jgi:hypothetical protein
MREYLRVATTSFDVFDDCDHVLREIDQTDLAQVIDERADRYHRTRMPLPPWLALPWQGTLRWHTGRGDLFAGPTDQFARSSEANIETIILPKGRCRLPSNTKRRFASRRFAREVGQID